MKRTYAVLMCLFWSVMMFAQGDRNGPIQVPPTEDCSGVRVWVETVVWNGDYNRLTNMINREKVYYGVGDHNLIPLDNHECYHIAVLRFSRNPNYDDGDDTFSVDISADLTHSLKPIYFVFGTRHNVGVQRINDYTFNLEIDQESLLKSGGGVITAVGIMGRAKSLSGDPCLYVNYDNRITNQNCPLPSNSEYVCTNSYIGCVQTDQDDEHPRVEAGATPSVRSYPNPAQDYLFVEVEDLDIQNANILNLQGQSVSHQVGIYYAEDRLKIDVANLVAGLYILQVETSSGRVAKKIYIQ